MLPPNTTDLPLVSVIVPVYREQAGIGAFVRRLRHIFPADRHEIIVVDGSPGRETIAALGSTAIITVGSARGRGIQMNTGALRARGAILLFIHADTRLPQNASRLIRNALKDRTIAGGAFALGIDSNVTSHRLIARAANWRTRLTRVPYGDQAIFIRRTVFANIGGFRDIPVMEDLELMHRLKQQGRRIMILPQSVRTSPRRLQQEGVVRCTLRNWLIRILYHCGVPARQISRFYN